MFVSKKLLDKMQSKLIKQHDEIEHLKKLFDAHERDHWKEKVTRTGQINHTIYKYKYDRWQPESKTSLSTLINLILNHLDVELTKTPPEQTILSPKKKAEPTCWGGGEGGEGSLLD